MPALGTTAVWGEVEWGRFVFERLREESALARAGARVIPVRGRAITVPRLLADGVATWTAELAEINSDGPTGDTLTLTPKKAANVVTLSNESIRDAPVSELDEVGAAMARSVARRVDLTALSTDAATATSPPGLLVGVQAQTGGINTVDQYIKALATIATVGGSGNVIFLNPADTLALQLLKQGTGSNVPLLQPDPTLPGRYSIGGAPIISTTAKVAGTALVADASTIVVAIGTDIQVSFSADAKFTADAVVARVVTRIDFAWSDIRGGVLIGT
jgi:HK97 family phage major capsid protein